MERRYNTLPSTSSGPPLRLGPKKHEDAPPRRKWATRRKADRRQGRDWLLKILSALGYLNTAIVIIGAILLAEAKPAAFHSMYRGLPLKNYWHPRILSYLFALCVFGFFLSLVGLFINSQRLKRKGDSIRAHLVVVVLFSLAGIIAYLISG